MPTNLVVNGVGYAYPNNADQTWGAAATNWAIAITNSCLQLSGGLFTLTADVDFGATYGVLANYWKSRSANIAQSGLFRMSNTDTIAFRNFANNGDNLLGCSTSDLLTFNGTQFFLNPMTTLGDTNYGGASGVATRLAGNTTSTKKYLSQTGTGSVSAAPAWAQVAFADLSGSATGAQLPNPSASTLGGVQSLAVVASKWINTISTSGVPGSTQPAITDLATIAANSIVGNNTGSSAVPAALTVAQVAALFTAPTVQKFLSGSGTYTTPANVKYIRVRMVGGGGGGAGSGGAGGTAATAGGTTTFGSSLLSASGGGFGTFSNVGGSGGGASLGTGPIGVALHGADGQGYSIVGASTFSISLCGGQGGSSAFGGGGAGGADRSVGIGGYTNTGSGGGGGGGIVTSSAYVTGSGGGSGGFVDAVILTPSATYAYAVGAAGGGGVAGTVPSGFGGGNGGSGIIIVEEFYQ